MSSLTGKSAVVTGGCSGIGYELVKAFLEQGIENVAILDLSDPKNICESLQNSYESQKVVFIQTDVSKKDQVKSAFDEIIRLFHCIDLVVGNAGIICERDYERTINVNLLGVLHSTYAGIESMSKEKGGRGGIIINVSSVSGLQGVSRMPSYCASKHGIIGLNRCFGDEYYYEKYGIKFITICPGVTKTAILKDYENQVNFGDLKDWKDFQLQTSASVARCVLEILHLAKNGSIWVIENGKMLEITLHEYLLTP